MGFLVPSVVHAIHQAPQVFPLLWLPPQQVVVEITRVVVENSLQLGSSVQITAHENSKYPFKKTVRLKCLNNEVT